MTPARWILKITPPTYDPWISALHETPGFTRAFSSFAFCDLELKQTEEKWPAAWRLDFMPALLSPNIFANRRSGKSLLHALPQQIHTKILSLTGRPAIAVF